GGELASLGPAAVQREPAPPVSPQRPYPTSLDGSDLSGAAVDRDDDDSPAAGDEAGAGEVAVDEALDAPVEAEPVWQRAAVIGDERHEALGVQPVQRRREERADVDQVADRARPDRPVELRSELAKAATVAHDQGE